MKTFFLHEYNQISTWFQCIEDFKVSESFLFFPKSQIHSNQVTFNGCVDICWCLFWVSWKWDADKMAKVADLCCRWVVDLKKQTNHTNNAKKLDFSLGVIVVCICSICTSLMCPMFIQRCMKETHFNWTQCVICYSFQLAVPCGVLLLV